MTQDQPAGVEGLPVEAAKGLHDSGGGPGRRSGPPSVVRVAHHRVAAMREVDPDLVGSPGVEAHAERGVGAVAGIDPVVGDRPAPAPSYHRHPGPVGGMAPDGCVDAAPRDDPAPDHREILAANRARGELLHQGLVGGQGAGDDQKTGGVPVETVHQAGPGDGGEPGIVVEEGVDQRPVRPAGARMDHHSGRLVDDDEGLVFVADGEVDGLSGVGRGGGVLGRRPELDEVSGLDRIAGPPAALLHGGRAVPDPSLEAGPRVLGCERGENDIEPSARQFFGNREPHRRFGYPIAMKRHAGLSVVFALLLTACSGNGDQGDPTRNLSEAELYRQARAALDDGDFETAIDYYGKLGARFPFGDYAGQGQLDLVYAYYKFSEPESALEEADRFIEFNPRHPEVAYAHYIKGLVNYNRRYGWFDRVLRADRAERDTSELAAAFGDFTTLVEQFPDSRYTADSRERMVELRDTLARHELRVAEYYLGRRVWVAAANRAEYVVSRFPSSPSVRRALAVMVRAYREMGLDDLAADSLRVLRTNYPDHPDPG